MKLHLPIAYGIVSLRILFSLDHIPLPSAMKISGTAHHRREEDPSIHRPFEVARNLTMSLILGRGPKKASGPFLVDPTRGPQSRHRSVRFGRANIRDVGGVAALLHARSRAAVPQHRACTPGFAAVIFLH